VASGARQTYLQRHKLVVDAANVCEACTIIQHRCGGRLEPFGNFTLGVGKLPEFSGRSHEDAHAGPVIRERT
jgi:hypothetical protein